MRDIVYLNFWVIVWQRTKTTKKLTYFNLVCIWYRKQSFYLRCKLVQTIYGKETSVYSICLGIYLSKPLKNSFLDHIRDKVFKNWPSKICGRQPLKNLKGYPFRFFKGYVFHKFYLVHSWILGLMYHEAAVWEADSHDQTFLIKIFASNIFCCCCLI